MENQSTPMQSVFSQSIFNRMCEDLKVRYESTVQFPHSRHKGAIIEFQVEGLQAAADKYHELLTEGFTLLPVTSPLNSFNLLGNANGVYLVQLSVIKPAEQQAAELEALFRDLKTQYLSDLEAAQAQEIERQVELALQAAARREAEKQEAARKAIAAKVRTEMQESREKLRAQLIENGKLNADGEAA
jgi:hypothetical protein